MSNRRAPTAPSRRFRSGLTVRVMLVLATLVLAGVLGASSVGTWMDQRAQLDDARDEAEELDARIAELESEIEARTSDEGARIEALCYGPFVEVGEELYAVPGVTGCVDSG